MKKTLIAVLLAGAAALVSDAKKSDDPVFMTIDGLEVRASEFEYLFNKNSQQQENPITFDEYLEMFVDYKLKVADAMAAGVDTTLKFKREFEKFTNELAIPYLRDSEMHDRLVKEAYSRLGREANVSHIMLPRDVKGGSRNAERLDSIRTAILTGTLSFDEAASKYSIDKASAGRGGLMGWITGGGRLPWKFEEASFSTPVGEVSGVIDSGAGLHIIKVNDTRETRGEVHARHILLLTRGLSDDKAAAQKARIDSIYNLAVAPNADFKALAQQYSQDPGSAKRGGDLGWFGSGRMVAEFDSVAFALANGEISKPFATAFGYHIVQKLGSRKPEVKPFDEISQAISASFDKDDRKSLVLSSGLRKVGENTNSRINPSLGQEVAAMAARLGAQPLEAALKSSQIVAMEIEGAPVSVAALIEKRPLPADVTADLAPTYIEAMANEEFERRMLELGKRDLYAGNAEYRNLSDEYRDGIMLFEVSDSKVWGKANKDSEGLEEYFQRNKANYAWDAPRFKGYVVLATNDSIEAAAKEFASQFDFEANAANFAKAMKKKFGQEVSISLVVTPQNENPVIDYLGFGASKPAPTPKSKWTNYMAFNARVIDAPEEALDVKSLVVADYQAALEKAWVEELRASHKVNIDKKVIKKMRK